MLAIPSVAVCGWLLMHNPTENLSCQLRNGNNHWRSILLQSVRHLLLRDGLKQKRNIASFNLSDIHTDRAKDELALECYETHDPEILK
jgi:hypothetical protein